MSNEPIITFTGNVGADPELRTTQAGKGVAGWSVAVTPRVKIGDEWADGETMWFRVVAWGHLAESAVEGVRKGDRIVVNGRLSKKSYDKNGVTRESLEVTAESFGVAPRAPKPQERASDPWTEPPF